MELSKIGHSFALVVKDEYRKKLMKNELNRIGCHSRVCVSSNDANITSDSGLIITIGDLHKMVSDRRITEMTDWFLIDDLDLLQDPSIRLSFEFNLDIYLDCGLVLEEILIRLPPTAHYVLTSTNFSHAELYPRKLSSLSCKSLCTIDRIVFSVDFDNSASSVPCRGGQTTSIWVPAQYFDSQGFEQYEIMLYFDSDSTGCSYPPKL